MNAVLASQYRGLIELMKREQLTVQVQCDNRYYAYVRYPAQIAGFPSEDVLRKLSIASFNETAFTLLARYNPEAFEWMRDIKIRSHITEYEALSLALQAPSALQYVFGASPNGNLLKQIRRCRDRLGLPLEIRKLQPVVFTVTRHGLARQLGQLAGPKPPTWEYEEIEDQMFLLKYFQAYHTQAVLGLIVWKGPQWKIIMGNAVPTWRTAGDVVVRRPGEVVPYGSFSWRMLRYSMPC